MDNHPTHLAFVNVVDNSGEKRLSTHRAVGRKRRWIQNLLFKVVCFARVRIYMRNDWRSHLAGLSAKRQGRTWTRLSLSLPLFFHRDTRDTSCRYTCLARFATDAARSEPRQATASSAREAIARTWWRHGESDSPWEVRPDTLGKRCCCDRPSRETLRLPPSRWCDRSPCPREEDTPCCRDWGSPCSTVNRQQWLYWKGDVRGLLDDDGEEAGPRKQLALLAVERKRAIVLHDWRSFKKGAATKTCVNIDRVTGTVVGGGSQRLCIRVVICFGLSWSRSITWHGLHLRFRTLFLEKRWLHKIFEEVQRVLGQGVIDRECSENTLLVDVWIGFPSAGKHAICSVAALLMAELQTVRTLICRIKNC